MHIEVDFPGGLAVSAKVGNHVVLTDQPTANGGEGAAPSPYELFLTSLATCAGYYALAFCREREIPTEGMRLESEFEKSPETKTLGSVKMKLVAPPGFPAKYVKAVERSMEQCTVKRAMDAHPAFEVEIVLG